MLPFERSRTIGVGIAIIVLLGSVATAAVAQSADPGPTAQPSPAPSASPALPAWPRIRFVGGTPDLMTVTSDCGIPGVDTFHLDLVGAGNTGWLDVTLTEYDSANFRFRGREVGRIFAPNDTVYDIDDEVAMAYDPATGNWYLKGFWMDKVPVVACLEASPVAT